jgi:hypothetical protein
MTQHTGIIRLAVSNPEIPTRVVLLRIATGRPATDFIIQEVRHIVAIAIICAEYYELIVSIRTGILVNTNTTA